MKQYTENVNTPPITNWAARAYPDSPNDNGVLASLPSVCYDNSQRGLEPR